MTIRSWHFEYKDRDGCDALVVEFYGGAPTLSDLRWLLSYLDDPARPVEAHTPVEWSAQTSPEAVVTLTVPLPPTPLADVVKLGQRARS